MMLMFMKCSANVKAKHQWCYTHLVLVVRHPIKGLASDANQRVNLQVSESPQRGLACRQASEPR